jgi:hypothetical protein
MITILKDSDDGVAGEIRSLGKPNDFIGNQNSNLLAWSILWHINLLLGNNRGIRKYSTSVTLQWLPKQTCSHGNN